MPRLWSSSLSLTISDAHRHPNPSHSIPRLIASRGIGGAATIFPVHESFIVQFLEVGPSKVKIDETAEKCCLDRPKVTIFYVAKIFIAGLDSVF